MREKKQSRRTSSKRVQEPKEIGIDPKNISIYRVSTETLLAAIEELTGPSDTTAVRGETEWLIHKLQQGVKREAELSVSSVIVPEKKVDEGVLIRSHSIVWMALVDELKNDWKRAYEISPHVWEELIAGAFSKAGFDEVILTPRSGDYGRDVIASTKGVGCIKIIGSVKAYKPGHLVKHDDVRALLGVLSGEQNASKGIVATTSDFAPKIVSDPFIRPFLPTRLELINGTQLMEWLAHLAEKK